MLAELKMELKCDQKLGAYNGSQTQGVLMRKIDSDYAEILHQQKTHPYSQSVYYEDGKTYWSVRTLTEEAYDRILMKLMLSSFQEFTLEKLDAKVEVVSKEIKTLKDEDLLKEFNSSDILRHIHVDFITPTSFKSGTRYVNYPDFRLMFQNLMNRYDSVNSEFGMRDYETLMQLVDSVYLGAYNLRSDRFPIEHININAFKGSMNIKFENNTATLARYLRLLFRFGEFSGIGIKTSAGMGKIECRYELQERG